MSTSRTGFRRLRNIVLLVAGAASVLAIGSYGIARPPRDRNFRAAEDSQTEKGVVERFTTAPRGEVDGAVLGGGVTIHWPPHVGDRVKEIIATGDRVEVVGERETGPAGDAVLEAQSITNVRSGKSLDMADYPPPGRPGPALRGRRVRESLDAKSVEGVVRRFTTAPRGEVDGAVLADGTVIHWPPHLENQFKDLIDEGDRVRVAGNMETGPEGDTHLEVRRLTNLRTGAASGNDDLPPSGRAENRQVRGDLDHRLQALEDQVEQLRRDVERLRRDR